MAIAAKLSLAGAGQARVPYGNAFERTFIDFEPPVLVAFLVMLWIGAAAARAIKSDNEIAAESGMTWSHPAWLVPTIAIAVFIATSTGTIVGMKSYAMSMDEYNATFQARIFAEGALRGPIPRQWHGLLDALAPLNVSAPLPAEGWASGYVPGYALIRAAVDRLTGNQAITNPILAGISVLLIARIARQLWPMEPHLSVVAAIMLALSSQFLVMSMTGWSMSAHLALNLGVLHAYLRRDFRGDILVAMLGSLALSLHNPFPHSLFMLPLAVRMLRERRVRLIAIAGPLYLASAYASWQWLKSMPPVGIGSRPFTEAFRFPDLTHLVYHFANLSLVITWQIPMVVVLFTLCIARWKDLRAVERDLLVGFAFTFLFYLFVPGTQVRGWGYRYVHGGLGSLILLATWGFRYLLMSPARQTAQRALLVSILVGVLVQVPIRTAQAVSFVSPFATASAAISELPADVVVIYTDSTWYGIDMARTDPLFSNGPVRLRGEKLSRPQVDSLRRALGDRIRVLSTAELVAMGLQPVIHSAPTR